MKPSGGRPRRRGGVTPARSLRVSDEAWDGARRRAEREGHTISSAAALLIDGYARGLISLPKVHVVYEAAKPKT